MQSKQDLRAAKASMKCAARNAAEHNNNNNNNNGDPAGESRSRSVTDNNVRASHGDAFKLCVRLKFRSQTTLGGL